MQITKSDLAEKLGVSRGRISQYIRQGMPSNANGSLDEAVCREWIKSTIASRAGGWGDGLRRCEASSGGKFATDRMALPGSDASTPPTRTFKEFFFRAGATQVVNGLRRERICAMVAEIALGLDLSPAQAYGIGILWNILIADVAGSLIGQDVELDEPDADPSNWAQFISACGVNPDFETWEMAAFLALGKFQDGPRGGGRP